MALFDKIRGLLGGKQGLDKIPADDIRKERLRLEQIEQRIGRDIDELERRKHQLFLKGKDEASQRQQVALARKIKELDASAHAKDRQLAMVSKQMRVLTGFTMIKENQSLTEELGVSSIISKMDLDELQGFVEKATVEGQFQMERFAQILHAMEVPEGAGGVEEEADTLAIVAAMQEAKSAEMENPEAAMESGLQRVDEILHGDSDATEVAEDLG